MAKVLLILGSNLGDRKVNLENAHKLLKQFAGDVLKMSSIYETEPWGCDYEYFFLNQVIELETDLDPWVLLSATQRIESILGRVRENERYAPRTMDIDILLYDDLIITSPGLIIPHPEMHKRRFVLNPMVEVFADLRHPKLGKSMLALQRECIDPKKAMKLHGNSL